MLCALLLASISRVPPPYSTPSLRMDPIVVRGKSPSFRVPQGFSIRPWATGFHSPRWMAVAPNGDVFLTESYKGRILVLRDRDRSGLADRPIVFATGLNLPHGMAFRDGWLYVGETNRVVRFPYQPGRTKAGKAEVVVPKLPSRGYRQHWTRNLAFSPDGRTLYVTVGSETNKSPEPWPRATILAFDPDGKNVRTVATGLRNPVGVAIRPGTEELWTTCVERDYMGNDVVPEFFTQVRQGDFFGWPWAYSGGIRDPRVSAKGMPKKPVRKPDVEFTAHSVPLGALFYTGQMFPEAYRGDALIAMRGSRNRKPMSGYKVVRVRFQNGRPSGVEDFITGWNPNPNSRRVYGRPVGLAQLPDGSVLVSDEAAHMVWRVTYRW